MTKPSKSRRNFIKISAATGGGLILGFNWIVGCKPTVEEVERVALEMPESWQEMNAFLKIGENGVVTILSPNPEIGQNVKTTMPLIVAEELDVDWEKVMVEQAPFDEVKYQRQLAGGSGSIRASWKALREAGATAKSLLIAAAAKQWEVEPSECSAANSIITGPAGQTIEYGAIATAAAALPAPDPESITLKDPKDFTLIGPGKRNVDLDAIVTGKPLFGLDTKLEGMVYAVVLRPPSFGMSMASYDDSAAKKINGVKDVVRFGDKVAVIANATWPALKGKKALKAVWKNKSELESTDEQNKDMLALLNKPADKPNRKDGDISKAFAEADNTIERTYEAPFLPHNCMEPMNFIANVTEDKVELIGPTQLPIVAQRDVAELLNRPKEQISVTMTRMGGGFGRRLNRDFLLEAAEISSLVKSPVQVVYSREDDMTAGIYRPAAKYKFKAALKDGKMTAYHLVGTAANTRNATRENNFPAGSVENYLAESHNYESAVTTGPWRAPVTNFLAYAEQAFLDEVAGELEKDPVTLRLELFDRAKNNPVGEIDYDVDRFRKVVELARDKSNWGKPSAGKSLGFSSYFSHNTYVAEVAEVEMIDDVPTVTKMTCAIDCGIVVNRLGALNQVEGGIIDGIGHAMYGDLKLVSGRPTQTNFDSFRLLRMGEHCEIETHFVDNGIDPTGLGEPTLPPAGGAVANAIHAATGKRIYSQPFVKEMEVLG